jgi:hypothetical protein
MATSKEHIKVAIKARPLSKQEKDAKLRQLWRMNNKTVKSLDKQRIHSFGNKIDENSKSVVGCSYGFYM